MYDEYLAHYGVKGMKWRHRKAQQALYNNVLKGSKENAAKALYKNMLGTRGDPDSRGYIDNKGNYRSYSKLQMEINRLNYNRAKKKVGLTKGSNETTEKVNDFIKKASTKLSKRKKKKH